MDGGLGVVGPGTRRGRGDGQAILELFRGEGGIHVAQANRPVIAPGVGDSHVPVNRHRQHRKPVVVHMLADKIDSPRRTAQPRLRPIPETPVQTLLSSPRSRSPRPKVGPDCMQGGGGDQRTMPEPRIQRMGLESELRLDETHQGLPDFGVAGNRCFPARCRVAVDIVAAAMPLKIAASLHKGSDKMLALHTSIPSSTVSAPV